MTPEQDAVLRSIRKLIDFWQISADELMPEGGFQPSTLHTQVPKVVASSGPKYQHPVSGQVWDGEGMQPAWLREALTQEGYTVDELRIKAKPVNPDVLP